MARIDIHQTNHQYLAVLIADNGVDVLASRTAATVDEAMRLLDEEILRQHVRVTLVEVERGIVEGNRAK